MSYSHKFLNHYHDSIGNISSGHITDHYSVYQMYSEDVKYLNSNYEDVTKKYYGYLLRDLEYSTSDLLRLRTDIFPGEIH